MYQNEEISFFNKDIKLVGALYKPRNKVYPVVVVLHGSNMGEESHYFYDHLKTALPEHGVGVFIYDRRGSGHSEGDFNTASFNDLAEDALAAVKALKLREDIDKEHIGFYGISQGAWIAPLAASISDSVSFLTLVSASGVSPAKQMLYTASISLRQAGFPEEIINYSLYLKKQVDDYFRGIADREAVETKLNASYGSDWYRESYLPSEAKLPLNIRESKWFYQLDFNPLECFSKVNIPILFVFAEHDIYVPVEESIRNYKHATFNNSMIDFIKVKNTDHFMMSLNSNKGNGETDHMSEYYISYLIKWIKIICNK